MENGGFLDALTVDLIDQGASRDAPPVGYRSVDNESIEGMSSMEGESSKASDKKTQNARCLETDEAKRE